MKKVLLIIGLVFTLSACSTGVNYKPETGKTLVVGRIIYTGKGHNNKITHINMNGVIKRGIEIIVKEPNAKKVTIKSGEEGLFYFYAPANTRISLKKLTLKKTDVDGSWSSLGSNIRVSFKTAKSGVTNIGTLNWKSTDDISGGRRNKDRMSTLKTIFKKLNPNSPWLNESWYVK